MHETEIAPSTGSNGKVVFADADSYSLLGDRQDELCHPRPENWEQVKQNASRSVYRGRIAGVDIYLKHFHSRTFFHRIARRLGLGGAKREMRFIRHLAFHGVPTVPVLAAMCRDGIEWLATKAVAPATPADEWHDAQLALGAQGRRNIQRAIVELGTIIGHMHAAGVVHRDLHCGNILVRTGGEGSLLVLTDLHRASRRRRLSRRMRAANLAQLFCDRYEFTSRSERLRFLKHYLRASGSQGTVRGWQCMIEDAAVRHRQRLYAQRDRRIEGNNRYFSPLRVKGGWRGHVVLASKRRMAGSRAAEVVFRADAWREALADPEALFSAPGGEIVKDSRSSLVVRRRLTVGDQSVEVFIKRRRRKYAWKVLLDCLRPSRSIRAFRLGHALLTRRIATALPLAALERRIGPFLLDSILITEKVDAPHLDRFLNTWLARPPRGQIPLTVVQQHRLAQEVLWQLGRLLQRLHDSNFAHRDLKATNIMVRWTPQRPPEVVLVDLDGLARVRRLTQRRRFQGLMRLNVSLLKCPVVNHAGRLRMLLGYLRRPGSGRINFKSYWRVLERWSAQKLRGQIRFRRKRQRAVRRPAS